jgi:hypothetical protein
MSYTKNTNNTNNNAKKPFCKVCFDAGKTDTAHFVRLNSNPDSPVTCPTLLALQCRYCFKSGHTVKYCSVLKQNNKEKERARRITTVQQPVILPVAKKSTNKFDALMDDSDDEQETTIDQQDFPTLAPVVSQKETTNTWASKAAAVAHIPQPVAVKNVEISKYDLEPPQYDDLDADYNDNENPYDYESVPAPIDYTEYNMKKRELWIDEEW